MTAFADNDGRGPTDTRHAQTLAAQCARGFARAVPPSKRAWGMPGAQCTRSLVCEVVVQNAHEYSQRSHRKSPGIPARNGFNGLLSCSPRRSGFFATVACENRFRKLDASVGASGPYDFTIRIQALSSAALSASTASGPNVRDDRATPLVSAKSVRMSERAVLAKPPVAGTEPVTPQRRQSL